MLLRARVHKSASIFAATIQCLLLSTMPRITRLRALQFAIIIIIIIIIALQYSHIYKTEYS